MRDTPLEPDEPRVGSFDPSELEQPANQDNENVNKTGTTTIGISTEDGVVIVTDRRASLGGRFVSNKNVVKVEQIHPNAAMTLVGSVGGAQSFIRQMRAEASLYESRRGESLSVEGLATFAGNLARGGPFFAINPIIGGVDESGSHVYSIDPAGGVMEDDWTVTGSGTMVATGSLENEYDPSMSLEEAEAIGAEAVATAAERDTGSGNGLAVARVTTEGVEVETYDSFENHDAI